MPSKIYVIWLRELIRFFRARSRVIGSLAMPLFFLAFLGMGIGPFVNAAGMGVDYVAFIAPGILSMILMFASVATGVSVIWDRQFGFMKEMLVAPVSRISIIIGKTLGGTTTSVLQALLLMVIMFIFGVRLTGGPLGILLAISFMPLISVAFVSMGIAFASRMEDFHGFQLIMNFIIFPMFLLSGALFPLTGLPAWLKSATLLDPLTYGVDGLRASLLGVSEFPILVDFSVLLAFSIVMILLGSYLFSKSV